jgi:hypothetical protein
MRLITESTKSVFADMEYPRQTVLFSLELVLNAATPEVKFLHLEAVCDLSSEDGDCSLRQLYQFDPARGLIPLDELKHPFLSRGTPQQFRQRYKEIRAYIEKELQPEMYLHWHSWRLAATLLAPESEAEKPHPREPRAA